MAKALWTLNINDYEPEIRDITYPYLKRYAAKCGAEFKEITERKFPDFPVSYEKMQLHKLGEPYEWNIFFDADALVHPDTPDFTNFLSKDTIAYNKLDFANIRFRYDKYFKRDGRNIGTGSWVTFASNWCLDVWRPMEESFEEMVEYVFPTAQETDPDKRKNNGTHKVKRSHLIDGFNQSRNIARFGLKVAKLQDLIEELIPGAGCFYHIYTHTTEEKVELLKKSAAKMK